MSIRHGTTTGYGYHRCRCAACTEAKRVYQAELRAGVRRPLRDAGPVRERLLSLQAEGWTLYRIAKHSGYDRPSLARIARGETRTVRQHTAEDILSIPVQGAAA